MAGHGIATQACPTSTGTQDYTKSGLETPVGGIFFQTFNTSINVDLAGLHLSIGATDLSGNGSVHWTAAEDGVATSNNNRGHDAAALIQCPEPPGTTAVDIQGDFNATVTDGIQVNWSNVSATGRFVSALMFQEGIENIDVQSLSVDTGASTAVSLSFQADIVIFIANGITSATAGTGHQLTIGIYDRVSDTYISYSTAAADADTSPSAVENLRTDAIYGSINTANGSPFNGFTLGSFTASGFTMTRQDSSDSVDFTMIAIELSEDYSSAVGTFAAPTSTGVASVISGLSFQPQMAMFLGNNQTVADTDSADSGTIMVGAVDGTNEFTVGCRYEDHDAAVNTDADSWHNNDNCIYMQDDVGALISEAAFDSFQSDGVDLDFSTADTAIRVGYLVIGTSAGPAPPPTPLSAGGIVVNP